MTNLDKCNGSCNVLSPKICVPKETKAINIKVFNTITNKNGAKTMTEHISCDGKCKFNSGIIKHANMNVKTIISAKKIIVGFLAHVFLRIANIYKVLLILL